eukprot:m.48435 g.48435  ORF g.48435 m.48435 type:complete len:229 (+) comp12400_c0_seq3:85-771(+)
MAQQIRAVWPMISMVVIAAVVLVLLASPSLFLSATAANAQSEQKYCPFFGNRGTERLSRPAVGERNLNCSWYYEDACCRSTEIYGVFQEQRAIPGADFGCQIALSRLMCWICDPDQASFYYGEQLYVCQSLCDYVYAACGSALIQGKAIAELYPSPTAFCEARRYQVVSDEQGGCFDGALRKTNAGGYYLAAREKPVADSAVVASPSHFVMLLTLTVATAMVQVLFSS